MAQEESIFEAAGEYCHSVLKVDAEIEESMKEMANLYAYNIEHIKSDGWWKVCKQLQAEIDRVITKSAYDIENHSTCFKIYLRCDCIFHI